MDVTHRSVHVTDTACAFLVEHSRSRCEVNTTYANQERQISSSGELACNTQEVRVSEARAEDGKEETCKRAKNSRAMPANRQHGRRLARASNPWRAVLGAAITAPTSRPSFSKLSRSGRVLTRPLRKETPSRRGSASALDAEPTSTRPTGVKAAGTSEAPSKSSLPSRSRRETSLSTLPRVLPSRSAQTKIVGKHFKAITA